MWTQGLRLLGELHLLDTCSPVLRLLHLRKQLVERRLRTAGSPEWHYLGHPLVFLPMVYARKV